MSDNKNQNMSILLVEDNAADVYLMREALEEAGFGYTLHVARDGNAMMDFLAHQDGGGGSWPDVVILDLNLPGKSGRQLMAEMQSKPTLKALPVAVFTTSREESRIVSEFPDIRSTFEAKTDDFRKLVEIVRRFRRFAQGEGATDTQAAGGEAYPNYLRHESELAGQRNFASSSAALPS